jgi:DNA-binding beta-propeller fold protein YncE
LQRAWIVAAVAAVLVLVAPAAGSPATGSTSLFSPRHSGVGGIVPTANAVTPSPSLGSGNLTYHGGAVMRKNTTYAIYWLPSGYSYNGNDAGYEATLDRFLVDVAHDSGLRTNVYAATTQYYDTLGGGTHHIAYDSSFGGALVDTDPFPSSGQCNDNLSSTPVCLYDSQIQTEIKSFVTSHGLPQNSTTLYAIFTPPNIGSCFDDGSGCAFQDYCAYHGSSLSAAGEILYANMPWISHVSGCDQGQYPNASDADPVINVLSHEHNEAITDPNVNEPDASHKSAWWDAAGYENGDKCAWIFGSVSGPYGGQWNQTINGHHYYLQLEWNNAGANCIQTLASPDLQLWGTRYATAGDDHANAQAFSPDGSLLYVTGLGNGGMVTIAYRTSNGSTAWSRIFESGSEGKAIAVSPDGSKVFVTGHTTSTGNGDYVTVAYDAATGARLWVQRFDSTYHLDDDPAGIAVAADGSKVFVAGTSTGGSTGKDYATVAYDATTGSRLWVTRYAGLGAAGDEDATAVAVAGTHVVVTGSSMSGPSGFDFATVSYDASTGAQAWVQRFNGPGSGDDDASGLAVSPDGTKAFVVGESYGAGGYRAQTVAYAVAGGAVAWSARFGNPGAAVRGPSVAVGPDGTRVYVAATTPGASSLDLSTVAYDSASGAQAWNASSNGPAGLADVATGIAVSPDGSKVVVAAGSQGASSGYDYVTIAYNAAAGTWQWTKRNNGAGNGDDIPSAVAISPESERVAVTGSSTGSGTGNDQSTLVYELS